MTALVITGLVLITPAVLMFIGALFLIAYALLEAAFRAVRKQFMRDPYNVVVVTALAMFIVGALLLAIGTSS